MMSSLLLGFESLEIVSKALAKGSLAVEWSRGTWLLIFQAGDTSSGVLLACFANASRLALMFTPSFAWRRSERLLALCDSVLGVYLYSNGVSSRILLFASRLAKTDETLNEHDTQTAKNAYVLTPNRMAGVVTEEPLKSKIYHSTNF